MTVKIHPYLVARLIAIQEAFGVPVLRSNYAPAMPVGPVVNPNDNGDTGSDGKGGTSGGGGAMQGIRGKVNHWKDLLKDEDEDDQQGGGRGTMKGLRGKDAEYAKQAMRKLTRAGRR